MYGLAILGAGPAGTGPLVWAAQNGRLHDLLDQGVAVVEQSTAPGGVIGKYIVNADSLSTSFIECLYAPAAQDVFAAVRAHEAARQLEQRRLEYPPLTLVARYLSHLCLTLEEVVAQHPGSRFLSGTRVTSLHLRSDGTWLIKCSPGDDVLARSVVLALGGRQDRAAMLASEVIPGIRLADVAPEKIVPSDVLLTQDGLVLAANFLSRARHPRAVIAGGSHSAFSAAWVLLTKLPATTFGEHDLTILHRRAPRIFYPSLEDALADGYLATGRDICPATKRVHRLGGLRNDGRELWRRLTGRPGTMPERRARMMSLVDTPADVLRRLLLEATLIVPALGYRLNTVPIFDAAGRRLSLMADRGAMAVDKESRLLLADGAPLPNVFGVGLGSGYRPWGKMAGEPGFDGQQNSLWLYQNGLGQIIYEGVRNCLSASAARPRAVFRHRRPAPTPETADTPLSADIDPVASANG